MATLVDRIVITVADIARAQAEYQILLDAEPLAVPQHISSTTVWLPLANTIIELKSGSLPKNRITGLVFSQSEAEEVERAVSNTRNLDLSVNDGRDSAAARSSAVGNATTIGVDHVVLRTADAQGCIDLFETKLDIRLALDKTVPEWGGRMLFFRPGKLTLEVIEAEDRKPSSDYFWGIALKCDSIEQRVAQLSSRGVQVSDIRSGRKPGTRVATVKSHTLGIPTLLIEPSP